MFTSHLLYYAGITVFLFAGMFVYFKIAGHFKIMDVPNERSSHNYMAIRGGGVVFWVAGVLFSIMHFPESMYFLAGLSLICGVSFWDDISSLPNKVRIVIHFLSISLIFYGLDMFLLFSLWQLLFFYVLFVGVLNAYNFMDGINGITGTYSLTILACLLYVNHLVISFAEPDLFNFAILACIVFLFFNFRNRAKCFAGDVGSMAISFWIVTLLLQLIITSGSFVWILFLAVYGTDSVCTILHRIYLKQNIFKPHRMHFYQILTNERKISHLTVSVFYALAQLIVCFITIYVFETKIMDFGWLFVLTLLPLLLIYSLKLKFTEIS